MNRMLLSLFSAAFLVFASTGCGDDESGSGGGGGTLGQGGSGGSFADGGSGGEGGTTDVSLGSIDVSLDCDDSCPTFLTVGESIAMVAEARDDEGTLVEGVSFSWSSEVEAVATVDQEGIVVGVAPGITRIIAAAEGVNGSFELEVRGPSLGIMITPGGQISSSDLADTFELTAIVTDESGAVVADAEIHWSTNPFVATATPPVGATTLIELVGGGETWIRATSPDLPGFVATLPALVSVDTSRSAMAIEAIAVGGSHSCGIHDGIAYCWGSNEFGQLGRGVDGDELPSASTPAPVQSDKTFVSIDTGLNHSCAIDTDGAIWCWGDNSYGQLGTGQGPSMLASSAVPLAFGVGFFDFSSVSLGDTHGCAVSTNNYAFCWGNNADGQTGVSSGCIGICLNMGIGIPGESDDEDLTLYPDIVSGEMGRVIAITAGKASTCAIEGIDDGDDGFESFGKLWCWGNNDLGTLGVGDTFPADLPLEVDTEQSFTAVQMSANHVCAIDREESVWCWGDNEAGQIAPKSDPKLTPVKLDASGVVAIAPGANHSCLIRADGSVQCRGSNAEGQIGWLDVADAEELGTVAKDFAVDQISSYGDTTCVRRLADATATASAYCWGSNSGGKLGAGFDDGLAPAPWPVTQPPLLR